MKKIGLLVIILLALPCHAGETVFYALRYSSKDRMCSPAATFASLKKHYRQIDIFIPQAYSVNAKGEVNKEVEPALLAFAQTHKMKIMPLVTNENFSKDIAHAILTNDEAQTKIINQLRELCLQHHYYGVQLDFEMVALSDRDALSHFYAKASEALHAAGLVVSYAVAPVVTEEPVSLYYKKIYANWEGAYDFKALGTSADFISIMAYNQHGGKTTPGPIASQPWTEQAVKYALQFVPAKKISIGIPAYSVHWYTGQEKVNNEDKIAIRARAMNYDDAMHLLKQRLASKVWSKSLGLHYSLFERAWLEEYVFLEDAKSFAAKKSLVRKYGLHGISVFDLGTEDPAIWG